MRKSTKSALQGLLHHAQARHRPLLQGGGCARGDGRARQTRLSYFDRGRSAAGARRGFERVRLKVTNAHVFKLPPKPSAGGWRGAEWRDKVWQGTLKVVERGEETAVLLVDNKEEKNIFAVCPIRHNLDGKTNVGNGVDRCIDSSRYFVLRIQNAQGRHLFIGLAFNERNDAFDFNTALEDSRREKELERRAAALGGGAGGGTTARGNVDYKRKEGENGWEVRSANCCERFGMPFLARR